MSLPKGIGLGLHWAWVPLFGFIFGCATIISLLVIWLAQGHPRYTQDESTVVYISDVGGANHALFIVLGTLTAIFFFASIFLDYRLRHTARIPVRVRRIERIAAALSVIFALICALGCILLTIFDTFNHSTLHWTFAIIFFVALLLSGLFNMIELGALSRDYPDNKKIKASFLLKVVVVVPGIIAIIIIGCLTKTCNDRTPPGASDYLTCNGPDSAAASLEWFITALFCVYILTLVFDMYPSRLTSRHRSIPRVTMGPPTHTVPGKKGLFGRGHSKGQEPHGTTTDGAGVPTAGVTNGHNAQHAAMPGTGNNMV